MEIIELMFSGRVGMKVVGISGWPEPWALWQDRHMTGQKSRYAV